MKITQKELEHLATLAKLKLTPEEKEKYLSNMDEIIEFLDQLKEPEDIELDEEELRMFVNEEHFDWAKQLLNNSIHKKWDFIGVKTSFKK